MFMRGSDPGTSFANKTAPSKINTNFSKEQKKKSSPLVMAQWLFTDIPVTLSNLKSVSIQHPIMKQIMQTQGLYGKSPYL